MLYPLWLYGLIIAPVFEYRQQEHSCYNKKVTGRLILAIISTLLEEAALAAIVLFGLPKLGINIPLWVLIVLMVGWGAYAVFTYRKGSLALGRKPEIVLPLIGSKGKVVSAIIPEGMVKIRGELWQAISAGEIIEVGEEITVVGQDGLILIVSKGNTMT